MKLAKKFIAGMLAAAITAFSMVPVSYAEYDGDPGISDEENVMPDLKLISDNEFYMKAGKKVYIPVQFALKNNGKYGYISVSASSGSSELTVEKTEKRLDNLSKPLTFDIEAPVSADAGIYEIIITTEMHGIDNEETKTQTFTVKMHVTSDLDISAVTIDSYKVSKPVIKPGDYFDLTVTLKNTSGADIYDAELELTGLNPSKFILYTGFSKQYVNIPDRSQGTVKFSLIAQNGIAYVRENLALTLSYMIDKKKPDTARSVSTSILLTCEPSEEAAADKYGAHDLTMTGYNVSSKSIKDGTKFELSVDVKNNGGNEIKAARVSVEADGSKFSIDSGLAYRDFDIKPGETKTLTFRLIGGTGISAARESIPIKIDFGSNSSVVGAVVTCSPVAAKDAFTVTGYTVSSDKISKNTLFTLSIDVLNSSGRKIEKARISLLGLDGTKFAVDSGLNYRIFDIEAGESKTIAFSLVGCGGINSVREVIPIELEYGGNTDTINATVKCAPSDGEGTGDDGRKIFAPNIIIESYEFGDAFVTAGTQFPLTMKIKNVSSSAVIENLKVTISGGASGSDMTVAFSPANSSNTFFFEKLGSKETTDIKMDLLAKADALPNSYPVEVAFAFEYSVGNERFQAGGHTETITIPLRQEDRLTINDPEVPSWAVGVGEMVTINTSLVNKGKSGVYNVTATVEGEGFSVETPSYYIGNIGSGSEEYYDAKITPFNEGEVSGELVFTYEDANGEAKEKRIPFTFQTMSMNYDGMDGGFTDGGYMDGGYTDGGMDGGMNGNTGEGGDYTWIWFVVVGGVVAAAAVVVVIVIMKKKKKAELADDDEDI